MLEKIKNNLENRDIDAIILDINNQTHDNELLDLLSDFYIKEKDICNVVLYLNTLKNEKSMKRKSKESGYFEYNYN